MTFQQELNSWLSPSAVQIQPVPSIGSPAPSSTKLPLNNKPTIIAFLRHCGCPFAEKTFRNLVNIASKNASISCIAVSHSSQEATDTWVTSVGGSWDVKVIVDEERDIYAQYGLGVSSLWHVLNPMSMLSVYKLGKAEGIWNRPTESGNRWQTAGSFAVDKAGMVKWVRVNASANDVPDFMDAVDALA